MLDQGSQNSERQKDIGPNVLVLICRAFAVTLEVVLHRGMGARAIGLPGFVACLFMPFWAAMWPEEDPAPLLYYGWLFMLMCVVAKLTTGRRDRQGVMQHSRYSGWPRLKFLLPRCSELTFKRFVEPAIAFAVGGLLCEFSPVLGSYLMMAAFCLLGSVNMVEAAEQARAQEMNDALISQRQAAERFRRMSGDWF